VQSLGYLSEQVSLSAGVRQGGILSPLLFSSYVNTLLDKLEQSGLGCFVNKKCLNSFMYADDLILLSLSVTDSQKLVNICNDVLIELDLTINTDKSHCMRIGPRFNSPCSCITINNQSLNWVNKSKFLGMTIVSSAGFTCDFHEARSNFYKASNSILSNLGSNLPINLVLKLIASKCLPILMYGLSAVSISSSELRKLTFAYNSIFYKLFNVKSKSEIAFSQYYCNYLDFTDLQSYFRLCFLNKLLIKGELSSKSKLNESDLFDLNSLSKKYNLLSTDSNFNIKNKIWIFVENNFLMTQLIN